jgi:hypothetical protein
MTLDTECMTGKPEVIVSSLGFVTEKRVVSK